MKNAILRKRIQQGDQNYQIMQVRIFFLVLLFFSLCTPKSYSQQLINGTFMGFGGLNFNKFSDDIFFSSHSNKAYQFKPNQFSASLKFSYGYLSRFEYRNVSLSFSAGLSMIDRLRVKYNDFLMPDDESYSEINALDLNLKPSLLIFLPPTFAGRYYLEAGYNFSFPILVWEDITNHRLDEYGYQNTVKSICEFNRIKMSNSLGIGLMGNDLSIGLIYSFASINQCYISGLSIIVCFFNSGSRLRKDKVYFQ